MRASLRSVRLLVVYAVVSLFAGSFRDAALHPTDVVGIVGTRAVAALHAPDAQHASRPSRATPTPRAAILRTDASLARTPRPAVRIADAPANTTELVVLVRQRFAEHAALLC